MKNDKIATPCCNAEFDLIHGLHIAWASKIPQWHCYKCKKEFCDQELLELVKEKEFWEMSDLLCDDEEE
jgi:hypothetical protein